MAGIQPVSGPDFHNSTPCENGGLRTALQQLNQVRKTGHCAAKHGASLMVTFIYPRPVGGLLR